MNAAAAAAVTTSSALYAVIPTSAAAAASSSSSVLSGLTNNPHIVGAAWLLSSALFTTYSTTKFLKYNINNEDDHIDDNDNEVSTVVNSPLLTRNTIVDNGDSSSSGNGNKNIFGRRRHRRQPFSHPAATLLSSSVSKAPSAAITTTTATATTLQGSSSSSSSSSSRISRPTLLTVYRFGGSLLLGLLLHPQFLQLLPRIYETLYNMPAFLLPALLLFIANYCNSIALNRIGISLTYTSKCGIPLITLLLTLLLDGRTSLPNGLALASLVPIALGIGAASWNAPTFETIGFVAACLSTAAQAALNVTSKRCMMKTGITGVASQRVMVAIGFVLASVMALLESFQTTTNRATRTTQQGHQERHVQQQDVDKLQSTSTSSAIAQTQARSRPAAQSPPPPPPPPFGLVTSMAVSAYHIEYVLSFMFVRLVQPITYGTCDAIRRLCIILSGRAMFGGPPLTRVNVFGIALALLGAMSYSIASNI
jgi:Triose-phosphate Transporter family